MTKPMIVGITGASGVIYGVELLRALKQLGVPTHLIVSDSGARNFAIETEYSIEQVRGMADVVYNNKDLAAAVASGSFRTQGMIIAPCSVKTLSAVANSFTYNLLIRAADVTLKERRPLVLMVRETPLHKGHIDLMRKAAEMGAVILPPMPAFYHMPKTIMDLVHQSIGKALDQVGIEHNLFRRWTGAAKDDGKVAVLEHHRGGELA
jgi:flavin prenyltransferase